MNSHLLLLPIVLLMAGLNEFDARSTYRRDHVRPGAHIITAVLTGVAVCWWIASPLVMSGSLANLTGVALLGLMFVPNRLIVRIVGREPKWELYGLLWEAIRLDRKNPKPRSDVVIARMARIVGRIDAYRTPETDEFCDLLVQEYQAWMNDAFAPLYMAARTIRIHEVEVELYGDRARRTELDPDEATFRWKLWRTYGALIQAGAAHPSPAVRELCERLIADLDLYRRSDTIAFIDAIQKSAGAWLRSDTSVPWPPEGFDQMRSGAAQAEYDRLWARVSVFWGARMDDEDEKLFEDVMVAGRG